MTTANTKIASGVNESKLYLYFCQISKNIIQFLVCCKISVVYVCHDMKKVENCWYRNWWYTHTCDIINVLLIWETSHNFHSAFVSLQLGGRTLSTACLRLTGAQAMPVTHALSTASFTLQRCRETLQLTKPKIFTMWLFAEKLSWSQV